jgi:hypothetical protein
MLDPPKAMFSVCTNGFALMRVRLDNPVDKAGLQSIPPLLPETMVILDTMLGFNVDPKARSELFTTLEVALFTPLDKQDAFDNDVDDGVVVASTVSLFRSIIFFELSSVVSPKDRFFA